MSMYFKEGAARASAAQRTKFATGIARAQDILDKMAANGEIPVIFTPDKPQLDPSLEGKVDQRTVRIGMKEKGVLLQGVGRSVSIYARSIVENPQFPMSKEPADVPVGIVAVEDLVPGKQQFVTIEEIFRAAEEKGFEKLHPEAFLELVANMNDQLYGDVVVGGHEPITDSDGLPTLLFAEHGVSGRWLLGDWTAPRFGVRSSSRLAFGLRQ